MEFLDIYDASKRPTGKVVPRGTPRGAGEYCVVVSVWVVNSRGELLLTLRSMEKDSFPGLWENTEGAVQAGESSTDAILRELWEETGIRAEPGEVRLMDSHRDTQRQAFYDAFVMKRDVPQEELRLQPGETDAAVWVTVERFEEMCRAGLVAWPIAERYERMQPELGKFIAACMKD